MYFEKAYFLKLNYIPSSTEFETRILSWNVIKYNS